MKINLPNFILTAFVGGLLGVSLSNPLLFLPACIAWGIFASFFFPVIDFD